MDSRPMATLVVAAVLLGASALAPEALANPKKINRCQTITEPGTYALARNLHASGDCLVIAADFVTLDLMGFVVMGPGNGTGSGVTTDGTQEVARQGLVVRNGTVTGFEEGVGLEFSRSSAIERIRATHNHFGIVAGPGSLVTDNVANDNAVGFVVVCRSNVRGNIAIDNPSGDLLTFAHLGDCTLNHNLPPP